MKTAPHRLICNSGTHHTKKTQQALVATSMLGENIINDAPNLQQKALKTWNLHRFFTVSIPSDLLHHFKLRKFPLIYQYMAFKMHWGLTCHLRRVWNNNCYVLYFMSLPLSFLTCKCCCNLAASLSQITECRDFSLEGDTEFFEVWKPSTESLTLDHMVSS